MSINEKPLLISAMLGAKVVDDAALPISA